MKTFKLKRGPLLSWDIYATYLAEQAINFNKELEISVLKNFEDQFNWLIDTESLLKHRDYDALVLTNYNQEIQWVNKGFTRMTGYPAKFAKGRMPKFLQGEATSKAGVRNIKSHLKRGVEVKETLVNYRKNGDTYNCEIHILPLKDKNETITHLLAMEKVV